MSRKRQREMPAMKRMDIERFPVHYGTPKEYIEAVKNLARRFDEYEEFAWDAKQTSEEDWQIAIELLQGIGMFDDSLVEEMQHIADIGRDFLDKDYHRALAKGTTYRAWNRDMERRFKRFNTSVSRKRPLLDMMMQHWADVAAEVKAKEILEQSKNPAEDFLNIIRKDPKSTISNVMRMYVVGWGLQEMGIKPIWGEERLDYDELLETYKNINFLPSKGKQMSITDVRGSRLYDVVVNVGETQNPLTIATCVIFYEGLHFIGNISRITGEITLVHNPVMPVDRALGESAYKKIKRDVWQLLDRAYKNGDLEEELLFNAEDTDEVPIPAPTFEEEIIEDDVQEPFPEEPEIDIEEEPEEEIEELDDIWIEYIEETPEPIPEPTKEQEPIPEPTSRPEKKKRIPLPKNLRFREFVETLERSGVSVRPGGRHGVASYKGNSIALFGPHKGDPARNRFLVRRILRYLEVEEEFAKNLKGRKTEV